MTARSTRISSGTSASGKVLKSNGDGTASWLDDLTGATPGGVDVANLSQDVRDRLKLTAITILDGTTNGYWTTPDASKWDVTGKHEQRTFLQLDSWLGGTHGMTLGFAKWNGPGNQRSYNPHLDNLGRLVMDWSTVGTAGQAALQGIKIMPSNLPTGTRICLRYVMDPTGGPAGVATITWSWTTVQNPTAGDFVTLETVNGAAGGALFSGSARVMLGMNDASVGNQSPFAGTIYKAELRDGSGTLIDDFNADTLSPGDTTTTGTNGSAWTAGSGASVVLFESDQPSLQSLFGFYDTTTYGALCDLRRVQASATTAASASVTAASGFLDNNKDVGKLVCIVGAGAVIRTASDGAMSTSASPQADRNILTGSGFTTDCNGKYITITGVGTASATRIGKVLGIISSTQLRVNFLPGTSATSQTYTISHNLYATATASTPTTLTLDTNAGVSIASAELYIATDDAPAIQAAITAAEGAKNSGYTLYHRAPSGIGTGLLMTKPCRLIGQGTEGYSSTLSSGTVRLRPMKPGLVALTIGSATTSLGVRGSITSGAHTLTDPDAKFTSTTAASRAIYVWAAGTPGVAGDIYAVLETTIASVDSDTQLTLTAAAGMTATETIYSIGQGENLPFMGGELSRIHIQGFADQKCGLHVMNAGGWIGDRITISDYTDGVGFVDDRGTGFDANTELVSPNIVDCRKGMVLLGGIMKISGYANFDGLSNLVSVCPAPGSIGIICQNFTLITDSVNVQAFEKWGHFSGSTYLNLRGVRAECNPEGLVISTDGTNGNRASSIECVSWSNSALGKQGKGLVVTAGSFTGFIAPGYYIQSDTDMYGSSDATALALWQRRDANLTQSYAASNVSTDRSYDANSTTLDEVADVLGTLIADLRTQGVVK